mgnify:CR=1 FL=1
MLYPIAFYRCNCILHLSVNGIMSAGRKDYICKNAFRVMSELTGSVSNSVCYIAMHINVAIRRANGENS